MAYRRMRMIATGLLLLMGGVYIAARLHENAHPAIGFIRAFAEAGMVGGLADWFAVTALFRHPLGIPIPHTAIIPRKKDQLGSALAQFLKDNFLLPGVIARRMKKMDVAGAMGRFLMHPSGGERRLKHGASRLMANAIEAMDGDRLGGMAKTAIHTELDRLNAAPLLGQLIETAMAQGKHKPLIDSAIAWSARTLESQQQTIHDIVHERANSIMRWTGMDEKLAGAIVSGLLNLLHDVADDPQHPLRGKGEEAIAQLARRLQNEPVLQARVGEWKRELLANPALGDFISGMWESARAKLLIAARDPDGAMAGHLGEILIQIGHTLQSDGRLSSEINRFARRAAVGTAANYGSAIVTLVSDTVRAWDANTVTDRVEQAVGRDLQYIRINGTLVGGMVGLMLHTIGLWLG